MTTTICSTSTLTTSTTSTTSTVRRRRRRRRRLPSLAQGDLDMYTEANLEKRFKLRRAPEVLEALQMWWSCAQRSIRTERREGHGLVRDEYMRICMKIYRAMIAEFDEAEAAECSEQDWVQDAKGEPELSRERFMDAMFELADVWTKSIEPQAIGPV